MWPSAQGQIQTSVQAGGIAKALIRFSTSDSESFDPSARVYLYPFPAFSRCMPGRASETYLRPADSAASLGSTIACALSAKSTNTDKALHLPPQTNLLEPGSAKKVTLTPPASGPVARAISGACPFFLDQSIASCLF